MSNNRVSGIASLLEAALNYAKNNWPIFPCHSVNNAGVCSCNSKQCDRAGKHPRTTNGSKDATTNLTQISAWWKKWPTANIGLLTGLKSGLLIVDVDGEDARVSLENLGQLPETLTHGTGRAGDKHLVFSYPKHAPPIRNSAGKLGKGLDIRGEGGYVIAPPSAHASGRHYIVASECPIAAPPEWLIARLVDKTEKHRKVANNNPKVAEGERNNRVASLAGTMRRAGFSKEAIIPGCLQENESFNPPLPKAEVLRTVQSISRYPSQSEEKEDGLLVYGVDPIDKRVDKIDEILASMPEEQLFCTPFGRRLVHILEERKAEQSDHEVRRDPHALITVDVDPTYLRDVLSRSGRVRRYTRGKLEWADPSREDAETFLKRVEKTPARVNQRVLRLLSTTPILLSSGMIVCEPGYHQPSGTYISPSGNVFEDPDPEENLSLKQCRALWNENIHEPFRLFPFARSKDEAETEWSQTASFSVIISGAISIALRNLLSTVPVHCITAPAQASGKTLLVQATSALATGSLPSAISYDGAEEFQKLIPVLLLNGDRVTMVDNITMTVNNHKLAIALTQQGSMTCRILGQTKAITIENQTCFFFTGNNLQLSGEMPTRCLIAGIEPDCEQPEHREFSFNPVDLCMDSHPSAIMTFLRVARAHHRLGFPKLEVVKKRPLRGFADYDRRVRAVLLWMGYSDPIATQDAIRANDPGRKDNSEVIWILGDHFGGDAFQVCELESTLSESSRVALMQITAHKQGEPFNGRKVGKYLSTQLCNRWFNGFRIVKTGRTPRGRDEWRIETRNQEIPKRREDEPL